MRWPFRRDTTPPPDNGGGAAVGGASGGGSAEVRAGWLDLPPLQRSTEDLKPIAPAASFRESLSAHQDPRFLAPLGHSLTVDAPAGEISNYAQPVEQRHEFTLPPSAVGFGTASSGAPASVQRAAEADSAPVVRTFSLPSAMMSPSAESRSAAVSPGQLPPIEARPTPVVAAPVVQTSRASSDVAPAGPNFASSDVVPAGSDFALSEVSHAAPDMPVVSRAVESPQAHQDHAHDHGSSGHGSSGHEVAAHAEVMSSPVAAEPATEEPAMLDQLPLIGSAESVGQSTFVSALGGPQAESEPDVVQRSAESRPAVPGTVGTGSVVQRAESTGPAVQRAVVPDASTQHGMASRPAVQRDANSRDSQATPPTGLGLPVQRDVAGPAGVERAAEVASDLQRAGGEQRPVVQRAAGAGGEGQPDVVPGPVVQRGVDGPEVQGPAQVDLVANRAAELGLVAQRAVEAQSVAQRAAEGEPATQRMADLQPSTPSMPVAQRAVEQGVVQRAADEQGLVQRAAEGEPVAQRPLIGGSVASQVAGVDAVELGPVVQRPGTVPSAVAGAPVEPTSGAGGAPVQRAGGDEQIPLAPVEVGLVGQRGLQRAVDTEAAHRVGAPELLWPPRVADSSGGVVPLSSSTPLTVPDGQRQVGSVPPAVQRVVYDHPELRTPSSSRTATAPSAQPSAVQAPAVQAEEQVLSWSAGESFHPEPAIQRAETAQADTPQISTVRTVSLQQMFSGYAAPEQAAPEQAVQRDEDPAEPAAPQPAVQAAAPAAQAAPAAGAPAKTVSAAELEELAKRLYEPLTAKLRAELWLDRERTGRVTDRW